MYTVIHWMISTNIAKAVVMVIVALASHVIGENCVILIILILSICFGVTYGYKLENKDNQSL